jgi:hypothetical protein
MLSPKQLSTEIRGIKTSAVAFREKVQSALIACAFYAFKDGNVTPFNDLIAAAGNGTHIRGITMWIELCAGIGRVKEEKIVLNTKVRNQSGVISEESFAPFEQEMSKVKWYEIAGKQRQESVFDEGAYIERVAKKLTKEGYPDLAEAIKRTELSWLVQKAAAAGTNATAVQ